MIVPSIYLPDEALLQKNEMFTVVYQYDRYMHYVIRKLILEEIPLVKNNKLVGVVRIKNIMYDIPEVRVVYKIIKTCNLDKWLLKKNYDKPDFCDAMDTVDLLTHYSKRKL